MNCPHDLIGRRINRVHVLEAIAHERPRNRDGETRGTQIRWQYRCVCECGNETYAWRPDLMRAKKVSCGCARKRPRPRTGPHVHAQELRESGMGLEALQFATRAWR